MAGHLELSSEHGDIPHRPERRARLWFCLVGLANSGQTYLVLLQAQSGFHLRNILHWESRDLLDLTARHDLYVVESSGKKIFSLRFYSMGIPKFVASLAFCPAGKVFSLHLSGHALRRYGHCDSTGTDLGDGEMGQGFCNSLHGVSNRHVFLLVPAFNGLSNQRAIFSASPLVQILDLKSAAASDSEKCSVSSHAALIHSCITGSARTASM